MKLNLTCPVVFFDLETTGTDINKDRIVEICYLKVWPNGNEDAHTMRINPGMHIPEESSKVHGIYDDDVKDCPTFKEVAKNIAKDFEGADIAGLFSPQGRDEHRGHKQRLLSHALAWLWHCQALPDR